MIENNKVTLWMGGEAYEKIKNGAEIIIESPCKEPFALTERDKKELCDYCKGDEGEYIINTRTGLSGKRDIYPGIQINICEGNLLSVTAISDVYEPNCTEAETKINYCPMCGRRLK